MKTTELKPYAKQWINCDRGWKNHTYIKLDCLSLSYPTQSLLKMHFRHCPRCNLKSIQKHGKESQWKNLQQKGLQKRWVFKICCFILNFYEIPTFPSAMLMEVHVCCRAGSWWLPGWKSCLGSGVTRHSVRSHSLLPCLTLSSTPTTRAALWFLLHDLWGNVHGFPAVWKEFQLGRQRSDIKLPRQVG